MLANGDAKKEVSKGDSLLESVQMVICTVWAKAVSMFRKSKRRRCHMLHKACQLSPFDLPFYSRSPEILTEAKICCDSSRFRKSPAQGGWVVGFFIKVGSQCLLRQRFGQ